MSDRPAIGVVGATGAVGSVTLELLEARGYDNVRVFASARSAGRQLGRFTVEEATPEALARGDVDLFLFSVGNGRVEGARPARGARRRGGDRQVGGLPARAGRAAGRARGERGPRAGAQGHPRQSELLRHSAHVCPEAVARRGRTGARARRDLPVGVGRRGAGDGAARGRSPCRARPADGLGLRRRGVRRGVEAPRRDAEDHGAARPADPGDVRPRPGDGRPRGGRVGRVRGRPLARASPRIAQCSPVGRRSRTSRLRARLPAATTCWSAGSAATRPSSEGSHSSWPATTSARARP